MSPTMWSHQCSVGVQAMDDQHGALLDALCELRVTMIRGADPTSIRTEFDRLVSLAQMHFDSEERLLLRYEFPGLTQHQQEHRSMLSRLAQYSTCLEQKQAASSATIADSLRGWLLAHMENADQLYASWLHEHGVY